MIYLALQPIRGTAGDVATTTGELLPHLFTRSQLRRIKTRWSFSVTLLQAFTRLPVKKHGALCCPDFPPSRILRRAIERSARQRYEYHIRIQVPVDFVYLNPVMDIYKISSMETQNALCVFQNYHCGAISVFFKAGILKVVFFIFGA
jgi:hypothetical protein